MLNKIILRSLLSITAIASILYIIAGLFLYFRQTRFIFFPRATIDTTPAAFNLKYQEIWLPVKTAADRVEKIHGWWILASTSSHRVMLYLHGNGINIGANVAHASRFHRMGFSVLLPDYRGYGLSEGSFPSESQVYQDAQVAWDYLVKEKKIPPQRIFIYGHFLGGAVAIDLAVKQPNADGLIVESSFTSVADMVNHQQIYRIFPIDLLLHQRFDAIDKVSSLAMPVLFIHGTADWQVPASMSQQLYEAAPRPKQIFLVPEAEHNKKQTFEFWLLQGMFVREILDYQDRET